MCIDVIFKKVETLVSGSEIFQNAIKRCPIELDRVVQWDPLYNKDVKFAHLFLSFYQDRLY